MRAAQQAREIQKGNLPRSTPAPKTQIHRNKNNAVIKPRKSNTNIMHNMRIEQYKQSAVPNHTEHKSPGMKMSTPSRQHKVQTQKTTIKPSTALQAPAQHNNIIDKHNIQLMKPARRQRSEWNKQQNM
jgi:hypothetical protein